MARGNGKPKTSLNQTAMPKFVDVKLSQDDKAAFLKQSWDELEIIGELQSLCDDGYRVGCSWSGEQQSYTVSLTCRDPESPNNGLCMTSFARSLAVAVCLTLFKHRVLTGGVWLGAAGAGSEDFG